MPRRYYHGGEGDSFTRTAESLRRLGRSIREDREYERGLREDAEKENIIRFSNEIVSDILMAQQQAKEQGVPLDLNQLLATNQEKWMRSGQAQYQLSPKGTMKSYAIAVNFFQNQNKTSQELLKQHREEEAYQRGERERGEYEQFAEGLGGLRVGTPTEEGAIMGVKPADEPTGLASPEDLRARLRGIAPQYRKQAEQDISYIPGMRAREEAEALDFARRKAGIQTPLQAAQTEASLALAEERRRPEEAKPEVTAKAALQRISVIEKLRAQMERGALDLNDPNVREEIKTNPMLAISIRQAGGNIGQMSKQARERLYATWDNEIRYLRQFIPAQFQQSGVAWKKYDY